MGSYQTAARLKRPISRWWRLVGGVLLDLAFGNVYGWSIFVAPLEKQFGWKRADTSMVFTIVIFMTGLTFVFSGWIYDKWGPTFCTFAGSILASAGFYLSAYTHSLTYLYLCFGVIGGFGSGLGCAVAITVTSKWFPDKRGLALGFIVGAYAAGSAIFAPLAAQVLIPNYGLPATFKILGVLFFAITFTGACLLKDPPAGYRPVGWSPEAELKAAASHYEFSASETLRTSTFWMMWLAYALGSAAGLMVISQLVPFASSRGISSTSLATMSLIVGAAASVAGRILSGWISDALGRINVLRLVIAISAIAMPLLYAAGGNVVALYTVVCVVYYCYGTQLSVNSAACADFFGVRNVGMNHGMLFTAWGTAGVIGPRLGGVLFDKYHNYRAAFYCAGALCVIAVGFEFLAKRPAIPEAKGVDGAFAEGNLAP